LAIAVTFVASSAVAFGASGVVTAPSSAVKLEALSDASPWLTGDDARAALLSAAAACPKPSSAKLRVPSMNAALAAARKQLDHHSSATARRKLDATSAVGNARKARLLAAAALAENRPEAALAILLDSRARAHSDSATRVDLGSVLVTLGLPAQALAVLDSVHSFGHTASSLGIGLKPVAMNDKGFALFQLGHFTAAGRDFAKAARGESLFAEARDNVAAAKLCADPHSPPANLLPAPWRDPNIPTVNDPSSGDLIPVTADVFNLSAGRQPAALQPKADSTEPYAELTIPWAQTAADMAAWEPMYAQLAQEVSDDVGVITQLDLQAGQQEATNSWLTQRRDNAIFAAMGLFTATNTQLASLTTAVGNSLDAAQGVQDQLNSDLGADQEACADAISQDCYDQKCTASEESAHTKWRADMEQADGSQGEAVELVLQEATALAADTNSAAAQQQLMLDVRVYADSNLLLVTQEAALWAQQLTYGVPCTISSTPAPAVGQIETPSGGAACQALPGNSFSISLADTVELDVDCGDVGVTVKEPGPLGLFASASYSLKAGSLTLFGGGMAGASGSFLPVSASFQAGMYVTVGDKGFEDAGVRLSLNAGSAGETVPSYGTSATVDFSFANGFDWSNFE
jgi:hypothetical protein